MTFDLVKQVISYLKTIEEYVSFLKTYLDQSTYDAFDQAYTSFFEDFENFIWWEYQNNENGLKTLIEEFGEIEIPVEKSMVSFCLDGLRQHIHTISCCESERKRIYSSYLKKRMGITNLEFLDKLNQRQWSVLENYIFEVEDAKELFACMKENNIHIFEK